MLHTAAPRRLMRAAVIGAVYSTLAATYALGQAPPSRGPMPPPGPPVAPISSMKSLGAGRYQIGQVTVDRRAHELTFPAHVAHLGEAPLEYLVVTTDGLKAYETLLEADVSGSELNLALILLGFDAEQSTHLRYQFDRNLPGGQVASISLRWQASGRTHEISADEALLADPQRKTIPPSIWVYTGSFAPPNGGPFGADVAGTLIGFVHDPNCLIENRLGLGIGAYGSIRGNRARMPPIGSPVEVIVEATGRTIAPGAPAKKAASP
jgi:hypothetical protein